MTLFIYCCIQVYSNLQPLCVCLSYQGTMNIIDQISADHDIDVQLWADELVDRIRKPSEDEIRHTDPSTPATFHPASMLQSSDESSSTVDGPDWSPLSTCDVDVIGSAQSTDEEEKSIPESNPESPELPV